ncbi:MAG: major capsid protein [Opitutaceae bacterium]
MPGLSQVHINAALTNFAIAYKPPGLIADELFPVVPVQKQSDTYWKVDAERAELRQADDRRALSGRANSIDWATGSETYSCQQHVLQQPVDDALIDNADTPIQPKLVATRQLKTRLGINKEIALATSLATAITQTAAVSAGVWTLATSDPITDLGTARKTIRSARGVDPNILALDVDAWDALLDHPDIIARLTGVKEVTRDNVAQVLGMILGFEKILIARAWKNTSTTATPSLTRIWGTTAIVAYVEPQPSLEALSLGYTMQWKGGGQDGYRVDEYRAESRESDVVRASRWYDQKAVDVACGYRITGCIS